MRDLYHLISTLFKETWYKPFIPIVSPSANFQDSLVNPQRLLHICLHYCLFNSSVNVAILANKAAVARDLLRKATTRIRASTKWLQQGVMTWNKGSLELENGSKILASATSSSAVRGGSYNIIFLDEFAYVPKQHIRTVLQFSLSYEFPLVKHPR